MTAKLRGRLSHFSDKSSTAIATIDAALQMRIPKTEIENLRSVS
jgi:hypothetical protein